LNLDLRIQALETNLTADAQDVVAFYAQPATARDPRPAGSILVVQADGKGVPMVQPRPEYPPLPLGKGQKRTKKKEAIITEYLAQGWPIGTSVVEGACGHLVKDRMEQVGMRWTQAGAQAMLDLRAIRRNGD